MTDLAETLLELLPSDTVIPQLRTLDGDPVTIAVLAEYLERDWRLYDADCSFDMSHTKHFCGYEHCSDG